MDTGQIILLIYITAFLFLFGESIQPAPRIAIYEAVACRQYYSRNALEPIDCKTAAVQEELSLLVGIERLSIIVPSIVAVPFARLADRVGHSLVLSIAILGVFLEDIFPFFITWFEGLFPIRLIWLHFVFSLFGGGFTVVVTMLFSDDVQHGDNNRETMLHVIAEQLVDANERTAVFFRIRAAGVGASVLGYAMSGVMMQINDWMPWAVGLTILIAAAVTAKLIPITTSQDLDEREPGSRNIDAGVNMRTKLKAAAKTAKQLGSFLIGNRNLLLMLVLVFLCQLGFDVVPLMLAIYISKRFDWTFSNASFLNSLEMLVELLALVILLPLFAANLPYLFQTRSRFQKDQYLARWSIVALGLGCLILGLAPKIYIAIAGILVLALGSGQDSLLRSMSTDLGSESEISSVYTAVTMLRAVGGSLSGPFYAGIYSVGLKLGWPSLPFILAGLFFTVGFVICSMVTDNTSNRRHLCAVEDETEEPLLS